MGGNGCWWRERRAATMPVGMMSQVRTCEACTVAIHPKGLVVLCPKHAKLDEMYEETKGVEEHFALLDRPTKRACCESAEGWRHTNICSNPPLVDRGR